MKLSTPWYTDPRQGQYHLSLDGAWQLAGLSETADPARITYPMTVTVPGTVWGQLYEAGVLPDPYFGTNSQLFAKEQDKIWYYRRTFSLDTLPAPQAWLCFDGSCYFTRVWLNGTLLGDHEGMFGGPVAEVSALLRAPGENELVAEVRAANWRDPDFRPRNTDQRANNPIVPWYMVLENHSAYNVMGLWRGVRLEFLNPVHLSRPVVTTVSIGDDEAELLFETEIAEPSVKENEMYISDSRMGWGRYPFSFGGGNRGYRQQKTYQVRLELTERATGNRVYCETEDYTPFDWEKSGSEKDYYENHHYRRTVRLRHPKLWWPADLGQPDLYDVRAVLLEDGNQLDEQLLTCGIRTVTRVESAGEKHRARWDRFHFVVNGKKVFLKGVNWMPIDQLLQCRDSEYRWTLETAKNMGVMMIRVWSGGGVPESETFYNVCDELGIMVWQDHMVANEDSASWDHDLHLNQECWNLFRIRKHPSLVIHCGGNEFNPYSLGNLAADALMEHAVQDLDGSREWVRTTPDRGSAHIYMDMEPSWYRTVTRQLPFVAESGIHSFPSMKGWKDVIGPEEMARPLNNIFEEASFTAEHPEIRNHFAEYDPGRVPRMLSRASAIENIRDASLSAMVESTQLAGYEFYQVMAESLRDNYPVTVGLMPWVFRRPSTCVGIQLEDGRGNPIAPYYALRNAYQALNVSLMLEHLTLKPGETIQLTADIQNGNGAEIPEAELKLEILGPDLRIAETRCVTVSVHADRSTDKLDLGTLTLPEAWTDRYFWLRLTLNNAHGVLARKFYWPRILSLLNDEETLRARREAPCPNLEIREGPWLKDQMLAAGSTDLAVELLCSGITPDRQTAALRIRNTGKLPAFPVVPDAEHLPCYASDAHFVLMPGETRDIDLTVFRRDGARETALTVTAWNAAPHRIEL